MKPRKRAPAPLAAISHADLAHVVGGRVAMAKGPSPEIVQGLKGLTEGVAALGQKRAADDAQQQQMTGQIMQQMMGRRG